MPVEDQHRWDAKYADRESAPVRPSLLLTGLDHLLPKSGHAIDVAGGAGRHAIWLAQRGLDVTLTDISPVGLDIARERAAAAGVELTTQHVDLEADPFPLGPNPSGKWDLIVSFQFLWRPLFTEFAKALAPGGLLVFSQPTVRNLEKHAKPPARFLLEEGELRQLASDLEIVHYEEDWLAEGRHDALLVARGAL